MIGQIESGFVSGFCNASYFAINTLQLSAVEHRLLMNERMECWLPELKKYKPHQSIITFREGYWFDRYEKELRVHILEEIIYWLENPIKKTYKTKKNRNRL